MVTVPDAVMGPVRVVVGAAGLLDTQFAKGHDAAAGHCGGEMEPVRRGRSAAAGKHMSGLRPALRAPKKEGPFRGLLKSSLSPSQGKITLQRYKHPIAIAYW